MLKEWMDVSMFNHEPDKYTCPFCVLVQGGEGKHNSQQDIVYRDSDVLAFISPRCWPNNPGHVIIVPTAHYEHIYDLPLQYASSIHKVARNVAIAFKYMYACDGVSTRQHNEPTGGQDVWHYHLHVFPRYNGDDLYRSHADKEFLPPEKRMLYAQRLRDYFGENRAI